MPLWRQGNKYKMPFLVNFAQLKLADDGMAAPSAPSDDALCSIAAYLKLAGKTDSKLPDNFISGDNTLVVGDGNCDTRKSSDDSCKCDEGTLNLSSYSQKNDWVSEGMVLKTNEHV